MTNISSWICRAFAASLLAFCCLAGSAYGGFIYVVTDSESGNNIYGFAVSEITGDLTPLAGFPVATGFLGSGLTNLEHAVIDKMNKRLYVANRGSDNITAYSIDESTGSITPLPFSPIAGVPNQRTLKIHPSGSPLIVGADTFASYVITTTTAVHAEGSPYAMPTGVSPAVSALSPDGQYYYAGGNSGGNIAGFLVNASTGVLTTLEGAPFAVGSNNPVPFAIDSTGRLFLSSSRQALMRVYTLPSGIPTAVTGSPFSIGETGFASIGALHQSGEFFALPNRTRGQVYMARITGSGAETALSVIEGSPFLTGGTTSQHSLFTEAGDRLFVANGGSRNLTRFNVDLKTGALSDRLVLDANTFGSEGSISGFVYVNFAAAQPVTVAGRVTSANNAGLGNAVVTMSDAKGVLRSTRTGSFGLFRFENVPSQATYTFAVQAKGAAFNPQTVTVTGEILDLNFGELSFTWSR